MSDEKLVVVITPTFMDGPVVRWYRSEAAARHGGEIMSASRNGVLVSGYLHEVPADAIADAQQAYRSLARRIYGADTPGDVAVLATHRGSVLAGTLTPIEHTQEVDDGQAVRAG